MGRLDNLLHFNLLFFGSNCEVCGLCHRRLRLPLAGRSFCCPWFSGCSWHKNYLLIGIVCYACQIVIDWFRVTRPRKTIRDIHLMNGNAFTEVGFSLGGPAMSVAGNLAVMDSFAHECHPVKPANHKIWPVLQTHSVGGDDDHGPETSCRVQSGGGGRLHLWSSSLWARGPSVWAFASSGFAQA